MVRDRFVKIEPEEYNSVDEQIISSKAKYSSMGQYNLKKSKKWVFKNLVRATISDFMYDFFVLCVTFLSMTSSLTTGSQPWISYITLDWKE